MKAIKRVGHRSVNATSPFSCKCGFDRNIAFALFNSDLDLTFRPTSNWGNYINFKQSGTVLTQVYNGCYCVLEILVGASTMSSLRRLKLLFHNDWLLIVTERGIYLGRLVVILAFAIDHSDFNGVVLMRSDVRIVDASGMKFLSSPLIATTRNSVFRLEEKLRKSKTKVKEFEDSITDLRRELRDGKSEVTPLLSGS